MENPGSSADPGFCFDLEIQAFWFFRKNHVYLAAGKVSPREMGRVELFQVATNYPVTITAEEPAFGLSYRPRYYARAAAGSFFR